MTQRNSSGAVGKIPARKKEVEVQMDAHETRLLNVARVFSLPTLGAEEWQAGSMTLRADGEPGEVIARGMIEERASGFSNVIEFNDPASSRGRELHGTGLRLGDDTGQPLLPILVVRNLAEVENEVTISIPYRDAEGNAGALAPEPVRLGPGEVRNLAPEVWEQLATLSDRDVLSAGYEVRTEGEAGSVLVSALSVSPSGREVYRVPMVDPQTKGSAGNYPWRLDPMTSTVVYLKNVTAETQQYTAQIDFEGGSYVLGLKELEAGQSVAIDLRRIRDDQEPDEQGNVIPLEATAGQLHWSVIGTDNHSMVGRAEYVNQAQGMASTFACSSCCPDTWATSYLNPPDRVILYQTNGVFSGFQQNRNCYGTLLSPFTASPSSWYTDSPSIASVNSSGAVTGVYPGNTAVNGGWNVTLWNYYGPSQGCRSTVRFIIPFAAVHVPPNLAITAWYPDLYASELPATQGKSVQFTATGNPPGGSYTWNTNSNKVSLSNTSEQVVTVTAVSGSDSALDIPITVTYTLNGETSQAATKNVTVHEPKRLELISDEVLSSAHTCLSGSSGGDCDTSTFPGNEEYTSYLRNREYAVIDQLDTTMDYWDMAIQETYSEITGSCGGPNIITGDSETKIITDCFFFCSEVCRLGGSCSPSATQTIKVNGFPVASFYVTWGCSDVSIDSIQ